MSEKELGALILDEAFTLSLGELCRSCGVSAEYAIALVEEGLLEPQGGEPSGWRFSGTAVRRVQVAVRLQRDLQLNLPGTALALELLEEVSALRRRVRRLESLLGE